MMDSNLNEEGRLFTFQEFEQSRDKAAFALAAIRAHEGTKFVQTAKRADRYDRQLNDGINSVMALMQTDGREGMRPIASNFFHRLCVQRVMYSLGKGIDWASDSAAIKARLGAHFAHDVQEVAYNAVIHGLSFGFWNLDRLHPIPVTQFVPFWDETSGALRAGVRYWRLATNRPLQAVVYEEDGYTRLAEHANSLVTVSEKRPYIERVSYTSAAPDESIIAGENYSALPIVAMWGSRLHQSALIGIERSIDAFDLIRTGFAADLKECAQIFWLVENRGGMDERDLAEFLDTLRLHHIANADTSGNGSVKPYTQEIPYQARESFLSLMRTGIYEDFGGLDVHMVEAGATNDHIQAAYQPLDENADDFEYQVKEFLEHVTLLAGIEDARPVFTRDRVSNQLETAQMIVAESPWLDDETILRKFPNITPDEVVSVLERRDSAVMGMNQ